MVNTNDLLLAELKFCYLVITDNRPPREAYEAAFGRPMGRGYTNLQEVLRRPRVQEELLRLRYGFVEKHDLTRLTAVEELAAIAFAQVPDYIEWDEDGSARIKPSGALTKRQAAAVKSVTTDKDGRIKLEFYSKLDAMAQISKLMGWLEPDSHTTVNNFVIQAPAVESDAEAFEKKAQKFLDITPEKPPET